MLFFESALAKIGALLALVLGAFGFIAYRENKAAKSAVDKVRADEAENDLKAVRDRMASDSIGDERAAELRRKYHSPEDG